MRRYTDTPALEVNLWRAGAQVLAWVAVHPKAWSANLTRINQQFPEGARLRPDFAVVELRGIHWRNPELRRLVCLCGAVAIVTDVVGLAVSVVLLSVFGVPGSAIVFGVFNAAAFTVALTGWMLAAGAVAPGVLTGAFIVIPLAVGGALAFADFGAYVNRETPYLVTGFRPFRAFISSDFGLPSASVCAFATGIAGSVLLHAHAGLDRGLIPGSLRGTRNAIIGAGLVLAYIVGVASLGIGSWVGDTYVGQVPAAWGATYGVVFGAMSGVAVSVGYFVPVLVRAGSRRSALLVATVGVLVAIAAGVVSGRGFDAERGVTFSGPAYFVGLGIAGGMAAAALFDVAYVLSGRIAGARAGAVAGALSGVAACLALFSVGYPFTPFAAAVLLATVMIGAAVGLSRRIWQPLLIYPLEMVVNLLLLGADIVGPRSRRPWLRFHAAFWDEFQDLPMPCLDEHLLLIGKQSPQEAEAAVRYLAGRRQKWAVHAYQTGADLLALEEIGSLEQLAKPRERPRLAANEREEARVFRVLDQFRHDIAVGLDHPSSRAQMDLLSVAQRGLAQVDQEVRRASPRYAARLHIVITHWQDLIQEWLTDHEHVDQPDSDIPNPYVVGPPMLRGDPLFVGRTEVVNLIAELSMSGARRPLLLFGPRRVGKTSLLKNLHQRLPKAVVSYVDLLDDITLLQSADGFWDEFALQMWRASADQMSTLEPPHEIPEVSRAATGLQRFDCWRDYVYARLRHEFGQSARLVLALDEFSELQRHFAQSEVRDILVKLRHIVEHEPWITLVVATYHTRDELIAGAEFYGELIELEPVHLGELDLEAALQLVYRPVEEFCLDYTPEALDLLLRVTGRHPLFLQRVCFDVVEHKNLQPVSVRYLVGQGDVDAVIPTSLERLTVVFAEMARNQVDADGRAVLSALAKRDEGAVMSAEDIAAACPSASPEVLGRLLRRELVEACDGGYRFRIELIRRWYAQG